MSLLEHSVKNLATALESLEARIDQQLAANMSAQGSSEESPQTRSSSDIASLKVAARAAHENAKLASTELCEIIDDAKALLASL